MLSKTVAVRASGLPGGIYSSTLIWIKIEFFRKKKREKVQKEITLKEAIKNFVKDDDYIGIGSFGANRTPICACHEIK